MIIIFFNCYWYSYHFLNCLNFFLVRFRFEMWTIFNFICFYLYFSIINYIDTNETFSYYTWTTMNLIGLTSQLSQWGCIFCNEFNPFITERMVWINHSLRNKILYHIFSLVSDAILSWCLPFNQLIWPAKYGMHCIKNRYDFFPNYIH